MKVRTRKSYPYRTFYNGKGERLAFYVIEVIGEEPRVLIYSGYFRKYGFDCLELKKSQLEDDQYRSMEFLEKYLPKDLAEAVFKYARKDLKCTKQFSLQSYIKWLENHKK